jgi:hypothetical protein
VRQVQVVKVDNEGLAMTLNTYFDRLDLLIQLGLAPQ